MDVFFTDEQISSIRDTTMPMLIVHSKRSMLEHQNRIDWRLNMISTKEIS